MTNTFWSFTTRQCRAKQKNTKQKSSAASAKRGSMAVMAQTQTPQTNSTVTTQSRKNTEADTTLRLANWHT
eukprot:2025987-Rhodomonas_salina.1